MSSWWKTLWIRDLLWHISRNASSEQGPASLCIATLLHKPEAARVHVGLDYVGFRAPNRFLIGYGMDYEQTGRHLPEIYIQVEEG